jgi:sulfur-carrier protein adenylyltransferase/sulfurtransferase
MTIQQITAEELRRYVESHHESDYVLMDVRQEEEYRLGHIPGGRLLPVHELIQSLDLLPTDKTLIFYCHSGGRSTAAAVMAEEEVPDRVILNLNGGMLAWDGAQLTDFPHIRLFGGQTREQIFETAIDLEKGAQRFYETVARGFAGRPRAEVFTRLARAEVAHARTIYGLWRKIRTDLEPFESLYDRQPGEVLEGGRSLEDALQSLAPASEDGFLRSIETALQIEFAAYDLYRAMADQDDEQAPGDAFIALAQAEKAHMRELIEALSA